MNRADPATKDASNPHKRHTGLGRVVRALRHSLNGLIAAYRHESAFRQECWVAVIAAPFAPWLSRDLSETTLLIASLVVVLIVELLNSSIEAAVDRVSFELHDLSRHAKDLASAAVFLSLLLCAGVWLSAIWQRLAAHA